jgi:hypothetical protein
MTRIIVALDGMTFNEAREKGLLSTLCKACEKGLIWGVKSATCSTVGCRQDPLIPEGRIQAGVMADVK